MQEDLQDGRAVACFIRGRLRDCCHGQPQDE